MSQAFYEQALICTNGHIQTMWLTSSPESLVAFCPKCGAKTLRQCPACNKPIRGAYNIPNYFGEVDEELPAFCHACGQPYPWTAATLEAAQEMAKELEALPPEDRDLLATSLADIMVDGPQTGLAASRTKRLLAKAGPAGNALYKVAMDLASKTAAEIIVSQT
ncbi:MAG: DUF2321 domain-containing protein [Armatimonadetes bacterium]|nr:DUF2321 domain-containing protein [Armatimonadota bacterium]